MWHILHQNRSLWLTVMLARHSATVGMGRELGKASGARGGGSWKIWCDTLLCLYLCPRRCPMFWYGRSATLLCGTGRLMEGQGGNERILSREISLVLWARS